MELRSDEFEPGGVIPEVYTKNGQGKSPPLRWTGVPNEAKELALVFENTTENFIHWLVYKVPAELRGLSGGFSHQAEPEAPLRVVQGTNSQGNVGYDGPLGSEGRKYRYAFRLYALDAPLELPPKADAPTLLKAMADHVLEEATLEATYERPRDRS